MKINYIKSFNNIRCEFICEMKEDEEVLWNIGLPTDKGLERLMWLRGFEMNSKNSGGVQGILLLHDVIKTCYKKTEFTYEVKGEYNEENIDEKRWLEIISKIYNFLHNGAKGDLT